MPARRHLQSVIESAIDFAIVVTDLQGLVTDWNAGAESILGWGREEILGKPGDCFFTPEDRASDRIRHEMRVSLAEGRASDERWHLRKDGSLFWASGEMMPLRSENGAYHGFVKILRDRTRQHEEGKRLFQSEERFRLLLQTIDTAFALVKVKFDAADRPIDYRFIEANPAFERQAGVDLRGKWVTEFAPDLEQFWFDTYGHVAKTGEPANFENHAKAFGRWFDVRAIRVGDPQDREIAIFFNDTTARRELQVRNAAIQELSDTLSDLTDSAEIAATAAEVLGRTLGASLVGYGTVNAGKDSLLVERDWAEPGIANLPGVIHFRDFGSYADDLVKGETVVVPDAALDERTWNFVDKLEAIGARAFINLPLFEHDRFVALLYVGQKEPRAWTADEVIFLRDVAERVRAATERAHQEKSLRESEAALRASEAVAREYLQRVQLALSAGAIIGTWNWDLPTDRFTVDEAFARSFGLDPALGREGLSLAQVVETVHPDDQAGLAEAINQVVARGGAYAHQYRVRRADGRYYWLEANGRVDHGPDGTPLRFPGVLIDVEERRAVEAERDRAAAALRALNETLEQRIADRTAALMQAEEKLRQSQKMEAVGQLTGGLAHDFNNLLTGVIGSLDMMQRRVRQGRSSDIERYVTAAMTSANRAAALTHRLLAFSRRQTLDPKFVDPNRLVADLEDLLQRTVGPAIHVATVLPGNVGAILCDSNQLENALLNLAINARDAMPHGGSLRIETGNTELDEAFASTRDMAPGHYVTLSVTDTGSGMPPEVIERAFDPFFTTKPLGEGTGLGLSMIYGFAKQSGGQVRIHSQVGIGTTVVLYLPLHSDKPEEKSQNDIRALERSSAGELVLVVDDEPAVRMLIADVLQELGYRAVEAVDGRSGLKQIERNLRFDLMVTDVGLPGGMNGRQLADAARELQPDLKVLFITGFAENAAVGGDALAPGMQMMTKPFTMEALTSRIRTMLSD